MSDVRLKLSPPWIVYIKKLEMMFDGDPEIAFNIDENIPSVTLSTNNGDKATALLKLLPNEKMFGNIMLKIDVDGPISNRAFVTNEELFKTVFDKNPALAYVVTIEGIVSAFTYVVFKNVVCQSFVDNLNDIHGIISTLYQDIAAEIFEDADIHGVCYNTDVEKKILGVPEQWP